MIIDHTHPAYVNRWKGSGKDRFNGAYYYSKEIVKNIIPAVKTDRNWITINQEGLTIDHSIVFVHNNKHPENYEHLRKHKDLILVCGIPETVKKVEHIGRAVYLPLSIDVSEVQAYARAKTRETAFAGRKIKTKGLSLPVNIDYLAGLPRPALLRLMAEYKRVYAVGRCAIEAKALGCEVLPYDPRFPDPEIWKVIDNREAAAMLQEIIDKIDY